MKYNFYLLFCAKQVNISKTIKFILKYRNAFKYAESDGSKSTRFSMVILEFSLSSFLISPLSRPRMSIKTALDFSRCG